MMIYDICLIERTHVIESHPIPGLPYGKDFHCGL